MNKCELCKNIGRIITKSLLYEVTAGIKPGLVDRFNSGSHKDMDIFTFIDSACAIGRYFEDFAFIGYEWDDLSSDCLLSIRPLGIECEKTMFNATNGINTHKGAIFSMSVISACAAYVYKKHSKIDIDTLCESCSLILQNIKNDFQNLENKENLTHGEKLYLKYGTLGIRGEALSGFSSVRKYAIPEIVKLDNPNYKKEDVLVNTLLSLISNVEDTNILARSNKKTMNYATDTAKKCLDLGGAFTEEGKKSILEADNLFRELNISHGGCADLLAVSIAIYFLTNLQ